MGSFYGNNNTTSEGGITPSEVEAKVADVKNHIVFSKVQPEGQKTGDVWFVIKQFLDNDNEDNNG